MTSISNDGVAIAPPGDHIAISMDSWTEPFWTAAKEGRLTAAQCADCGTFRSPPTPFCGNCQSQRIAWPMLPGTGTIFSFAICTRSPFPDIPDFTYVPIVVDLDGAPGARLVSNIIDIRPAEVAIGMKVAVTWSPIRDGWMVPVFRPAA